MSLAQSLNLVAETKPMGGSLTVSRRQRLIKAINHQIAQIRDELTMGDIPVGPQAFRWFELVGEE